MAVRKNVKRKIETHGPRKKCKDKFLEEVNEFPKVFLETNYVEEDELEDGKIRIMMNMTVIK